MKRGMTLWRYFTDSQEHAGGFIMVKAVVGATEMFRCRRFWCQTVHRW